ncbi:MAG: alpha/beta fold hydrolase [Pseudolysinimonas sp.]
MSTLLPGIVAHSVTTPRLTANVLERAGDDGTPVVFVHGNVSSSQFYMPTMLALPEGVRALAIDLRGFGDSQTLPVDASRGLRDFSDDVISVLDALGVQKAHLVGWSMGGGVVMQLMLDHADRIESVTLEAPVSPYGFGGTHGADGAANGAEAAGVGGGGANPEFVSRLEAGDTSDDPQVSPRSVYRTAYVKHPENVPNEDLWVESMLSTKTGLDNYPGDATATEAWPGFGPGSRGVLNTMAPGVCDLSGIADLATKPPILWIRGVDDAIVSDTSFFDINYLGQLGVIPGWPGEDLAPAQPMVTQTRSVLDRYRSNGGSYAELAWDECGHGPHLDRAAEFDAALAQHIRGGAK